MIGSITVVNKYKHQPDSSTVYIGRGSIFGNPFHVGMGRAKCIEKYRREVFNIKMNNPRSEYFEAIETLIDRVLAGEHIKLMCFCFPQACHRDVIKAYIESRIP